MKSVALSFSQMLRQMKNDPMLLVIAFVPVLIGLLFRIGIPLAEAQLTNYLALDYVIAPYYGLLDLLLILFTSTMFNLVVAMVVLEEADEGLISYLAITPLGKTGYLLSRFGLTGIISLAISLLLFTLFHLNGINIFMLFGLAIVGAAQGISAAMMIVTFSANKVEGMAAGKFTSLFALGALVPFFINGKIQCIFSVLPSFWLAKSIQENNCIYLEIALLVAFAWIMLLTKHFTRKRL